MPNSKSAEKSLRKSEKKRLLNKSRISALKTENKKLLAAIEDKDAESMDKHLPVTIKLLDKSVSKGIIKKNNASRKKSNLMKKVNQAKAAN